MLVVAGIAVFMLRQDTFSLPAPGVVNKTIGNSTDLLAEIPANIDQMMYMDVDD
ncbi:MAG: hypothetical protein H6765_02765 [Candidatus Peribacteria bacterium]|nr:MAG: hypothetical protein H6765_02765 [Candidatus Peribacteria bacterium]